MLALSARIQPLLRGHKYALFILQRAVLWLGMELLFIVGVIWEIARRFWLSVEFFLKDCPELLL